jgi:hypothetical protein
VRIISSSNMSNRRPMSAPSNRRRHPNPSLDFGYQHDLEPTLLAFEDDNEGVSQHDISTNPRNTHQVSNHMSSSRTPPLLQQSRRPQSAPRERPTSSDSNKESHQEVPDFFSQQDDLLARRTWSGADTTRRRHNTLSLPALSALKNKVDTMLAQDSKSCAKSVARHYMESCKGEHGDWRACRVPDLTSLPKRLIDAGLQSELTRCMSDLLYIQRRTACGPLRDLLDDFARTDASLDALISSERIQNRTDDASAALSRRAFLRCVCMCVCVCLLVFLCALCCMCDTALLPCHHGKWSCK